MTERVEDNMNPSLESLQIAAQCWCDPETSSIVMNERLAVAFAKRLDIQRAEVRRLRELADAAVEYVDSRNNLGIGIVPIHDRLLAAVSRHVEERGME